MKDKKMKFTITETNGDKPIEEWIVKNLKIYAEREHGVKLNVEIKNGPKQSDSPSNK